MPIVFVHGVNNRQNERYDVSLERLRVLFNTISVPKFNDKPSDVAIYIPYWGDLGGDSRSPLSGFATLPRGSFESFGAPPAYSEALARDLVQVIAVQPDQPLLVTARSVSLPCALDLLWACTEGSISDLALLAEMCEFMSRAFDYAERIPAPSWLAEVSSDSQLVFRLVQEIAIDEGTDQRELFGPRAWWGYLVSGASTVRDFAQQSLIGLPRRASSQAGLFFLRPWMTSVGSRTVGDALVYVSGRGPKDKPGKIVDRVRGDLQKAASTANGNDPLIVIGHSLGGVIAYDLLSYFEPSIKCDLLVTVGSQVGFFQELGILSGESDVNDSRRRRPANVQRWLNVFDTVDVLAFSTQPVFTGVDDFAFSNETVAISAHTAYFWSPRFHRRLGLRIFETLRRR